MNNKMKVGIAALTSVLLLASCGGGGSVTPPPAVTTGAVNLPANPNGYTLTVRDSAGNIVPAANYSKLAPGTYTATYSKDGFQPNTQSFTIVSGGSASIYYPTLAANTVSGAYYMDANGKMVAITKDDLDNAGTRFVFYAWLENEANAGLDPANLGAAAPTAGEQDEVAPLNSQNVAAGYVGYKAADGRVYPIVGANVRWDILEQTGNVRFSAADDGGQPSGAPITGQDINDNALSANTYTNSSTGTNARFPSSTQYPLYNVTGVNTPDTNGFTWTALNHDPAVTTQATARVRAIAYVNGTEITKQFLNKTFAPSAQLTITKTPDDNQAGLNQARDFTITVTNTGAGPATNIRLNDVLRSGDAAAYSITAPTGTTANATDGFDATFDLAPGASRTFTFPAQSSAVGVYCDVATIVSYENGAFGTVTPTLSDDACLTVTAPTLGINKTLGTVDANGVFSPIASGVTVAPNTPVYARITVSNNGNAAATNVVVTDALAQNTVAANYALSGSVTTAPQTVAVTNNGDDGFTSAAFNLAAGSSQTFTFAATGSVDGTYCDQGTFTATSNNGSAVTGTSDIPCFKVASPQLAITKTNSQASGQPPINLLTPGSSYVSTITVTNNGSAAATNVAVKDLLGNLNNANYMNYGSGSYVISGTAQTGSVTYDATTHTVSTVPAALTLNPGQSLTLTLTSTVPAGSPRGEYCDTGSYTSTNGGNGEARACVTVTSFISEQTQLTDTIDPIRAGDPVGTILASAASVEPSSNEGAVSNVLIYNFGAIDPIQQTPGVFNYSNTQVYYDPTPTRDPQTGAITSDYQNATAILLTDGNQYTASAASGTGQQTLTFVPSFRVAPGAVIWVRTNVTAPAGTTARQYQETMRWNNIAESSGTAQTNFKAESTTVIP
ncbi:DUF11 domain-containing protein [Deinococcus radiotolerans]|uniref:DUF11 domain-containing protein n=1 Tax=Deinococcus radiotolerans TaxID=1309407 RepID=A0ABQ2FEV9_9DEIO|nr:DUF11 domain-containing protein [Deinococcus radiotolerans]GGK86706.1 hypothetical protein GCM10010844_01490 [Deinococcus radiotolerans]